MLHGYKRVATAQVVPSGENPRTHSDTQIEQIRRSIREFGFTNPILIDEDNRLIAGHGRLQAAQAEGLTELPAIVVTGLTEAQKRALVIADNQLALNAGWDAELLKLNLETLQQEGVDLSIIGFSDEELAAILADITPVGLTDPDDAPDPPADPASLLGDTWLMGRHRLRCGDATSAEDVAVLVVGVIDCVFTSPPYGVGVDYGETYQDTLTNLREMLPKLADLWMGTVRPGGFAVVNFGDLVKGGEASGTKEISEYPMALEYWPSFTGKGWRLWSRRVWCKPGAGAGSMQCISSNRAATNWEHVWSFRKAGPRMFVKQITGDYPSQAGWFDTTHEHKLGVKLSVHGAGMPVTVAKRAIVWHSLTGGGVLEPFSGTGTTIIAGEMTGRAVYAMEISPAYVDVAVERWQAFTGKVATLEDGRSFAEVKEERHASPSAPAHAEGKSGGGSVRGGGGATPRHRKAGGDQHAHAPQALRQGARPRKGKGQRPGRKEPVPASH